MMSCENVEKAVGECDILVPEQMKLEGYTILSHY